MLQGRRLVLDIRTFRHGEVTCSVQEFGLYARVILDETSVDVVAGKGLAVAAGGEDDVLWRGQARARVSFRLEQLPAFFRPASDRAIGNETHLRP